jgi:CBS domain-containing protein
MALAAAFGLLTLALEVTDAHSLATSVAAWLARINAILAIFNMVPAFPLDGGRVLRAILWRRSGDRLRATATAAHGGRIFAFTLIAVGLFDFAAGGSLGGIWFVFLGWFLLGASRAEMGSVQLRAALGGQRASDIMTPHPVTAPGTLTLTELLDNYVVPSHHSTFPVVSEDGTLVGLITMNRMKVVPARAWPTTRVRDVARRLADVPRARSDDDATDVLTAMSEAPDGRVLVVDDGELVGIISPTDVTRALEMAGLRAAARNGPSSEGR